MKRIIAALILLAPSIASAQTVNDIAKKGACSTAGVIGISDQLVKAHMCLAPGLFVPFTPHAGISLSSSSVKPYLLASSRDALWKASASKALQVNSAFRTLADQYVLYYSGGCGLAAKPGNSNHETGRAVDLENWSAALSAMTAAGCEHPYPSSDPVHFDCPGIDAKADSIRAFQKLWNLNNPADKIDEDGIYGPATESRLAKSPAGGFTTPVDCSGPPPLDAEFVTQGSDAPKDPTGKNHFRVCAGAKVSFWFEVRNVGGVSWVDVDDGKPDAFGRAVRLGVPGDKPDVFTGDTRISLKLNTNPDVHSTKQTPPGGDCNDKPLCSRTIFRGEGSAPTTPGVVKTSWKLVDEGRAWFGPDMYLSYDVVDCAAGEDAGVVEDAGTSDDAGGDAGELQADNPDLQGGCACDLSKREKPSAWIALLGLLVTRTPSRERKRPGTNPKAPK
jgi:hypothetical protein